MEHEGSIGLQCHNFSGSNRRHLRKVIDRVVQRHQIILSALILSEYKAVVGRPKLSPYFSN